MFLRVLRCSNCGAQLQAPPADGWVKCAYCGTLCQLPGQPRHGTAPSGLPATAHPVASYRFRWSLVLFMPLIMILVGGVVTWISTREASSLADRVTRTTGLDRSPPVPDLHALAAVPPPPPPAPSTVPPPHPTHPHPATERTRKPAAPREQIDPICHLSINEQDAVARAHERDLASCLSGSDPAGTTYQVELDAVVEASGKVRTATARYEGTARAPAALPCIASRFRSWSYPPYGTMPMKCTISVEVSAPDAP